VQTRGFSSPLQLFLLIFNSYINISPESQIKMRENPDPGLEYTTTARKKQLKITKTSKENALNILEKT